MRTAEKAVKFGATALMLVLFLALPLATQSQTPTSPEAQVAAAIAKESTDPTSARKELEQLLPKLAQGVTRNTAQAKLCLLTAVDDPKAAIPLAVQGLKEARATGDKKNEAKLLYCQGYADD